MLTEAARDERAAIMHDRLAGGWTLQEVGTEFGISRERVRQIMVKEYGGLATIRPIHKGPTKLPPKQQVCHLCDETYTGKFKAHAAGKHEMNPSTTKEAYLRNEAIAADYVAGMKTVDIRTKYHIKPPAIYHAIRRRGIPQRYGNNSSYPRDKEWRLARSRDVMARNGTSAALHAGVVDLRAAGLSRREVADALAVNYRYVENVLTRHREGACLCGAEEIE